MAPSAGDWPGVIMTPEAPSDSSVVACRDLRIQDADHSLKILIQIHAPRLADKDFSCRYDVLGFDEPLSRAVYGVDSLQALLLSVCAIEKGLLPYKDRVSWLGERGDSGIPRMFFWQPLNASLRLRVEKAVDEFEKELAERLSDAGVLARPGPGRSDSDSGSPTRSLE
jgi:hypothetical protein